MTKAFVKVTKEIILTLSEEEAEFIKALVQNPPVYSDEVSITEESVQKDRIRESISEALDGLL